MNISFEELRDVNILYEKNMFNKYIRNRNKPINDDVVDDMSKLNNEADNVKRVISNSLLNDNELNDSFYTNYNRTTKSVPSNMQLNREIITDINNMYNNQTINSNSNDKVATLLNTLKTSTYKKPWNKLSVYHKMIKINEYITNTYGDKPSLVEKIEALINQKKMNSTKFVVYDPNTEKILQIPVIKCVNNEPLLTI